MKASPSRHPLAVALIALGLSGCATADFDQTLSRLNEASASSIGGQIQLAETPELREQSRAQVDALLQQPLGRGAAVQAMLSGSPEFQAIVARGKAELSRAAQSGRVANPVLALERVTAGPELELGRMLTFGLLDVLSLPWRQEAAQLTMQSAELHLAAEVLDQVHQVQLAWIDAVLARQRLDYAEQVYVNAEAGAILARRMEEAGNFSARERIRQQMFYSDAAVSRSLARQAAHAARERLVRRLGLTPQQAVRLRLPERLPDLPESVREAATMSPALADRLDVRLARQAYDTRLALSGVDTVSSLLDVELGVIRNTQRDRAEGTRSTERGLELEIRLPVFDWGGMRRQALRADLLALGSTVEATVRKAHSSVAEAYIAYRTAHDVARHYLEQVVPMQETLAEENVYRYNGMLIGTFELLADRRQQVMAVQGAIDALANFHRAELALEAELLGRPAPAVALTAGRSPAAAAADADH